MDIDSGVESIEGLGVPQLGEGSVFEANVESSLNSDRDGVKDETLRGKMEGQVGNDMGVEFMSKSERLDCQDLNASSCSRKVSCDGVEHEALEVNVEEEGDGGELTPRRVSVNTGSEPDLLTVADFIRHTKVDGNVSSGMKGKSCSKMEFEVSDLVWGKVRTHPWWPGQICDPSDASELAKKCCKKGSYLIAYFGDQTFAWNEEPKIRPFLEHCSKLEKQSDKEEFRNAVNCALHEVSRRVEFGLACSCISKTEYEKLKTQKIINAGIKKEASTRDGGDSSLSAAIFEPSKVIKLIKKLAQLPYDKAGRLELVIAVAQLSAFLRWKSYVPLPAENDTVVSFLGERNLCSEASDEELSVFENEMFVRKSESNSLQDKDISNTKAHKYLSPMSENESKGKDGGELIFQPCKKRKDLDALADEDVLPVIKDGKLVGILETKDNSLLKCWHIPGDSMNPSEEEQSLSDLEGIFCLSSLISENGLEGKGDDKLISQPSAKKRKEVDVMADDGALEHQKSESSQGISIA